VISAAPDATVVIDGSVPDLLQLAQAGETADLLLGCTGGGSNFGGLMFPFLREKWAGRMSPTVRAVEPAACPSQTQHVRLRLRRHRRDDAPDEDAHPRPRLRA
jgi:tryptophan synthase beta subunit